MIPLGSIARIITAGIVCAAVPLGILAYHAHSASNGSLIQINTVIQAVNQTQQGHHLSLYTPLSKIDLAAVAGPDRISEGTKVYVYFSKTGKRLSYAYAITAKEPVVECDPKACLIMSGKVSSVHNTILTVEFPFASIFIQKQAPKVGDTVSLDLSVTKSGRAILMSAKSGDNHQELAPKPTLPGFINTGASAAPAK